MREIKKTILMDKSVGTSLLGPIKILKAHLLEDKSILIEYSYKVNKIIEFKNINDFIAELKKDENVLISNNLNRNNKVQRTLHNSTSYEESEIESLLELFNN